LADIKGFNAAAEGRTRSKKRQAHRVSPDIRYDRLSTHRLYRLLFIVLLQRSGTAADAEETVMHADVEKFAAVQGEQQILLLFVVLCTVNQVLQDTYIV
jgi:hypothetical protein